MESTIERLPNLREYHRYVVSVGNISGEVISLPDYVEHGINGILHELRIFANKQ